MASIAEREAAVFMRTGARQPVTLVRGHGTRVWDEDGKEYLDFVAGIAADSLGHTHPTVVGALKAQADTLMHVSNIFYTVPQVELAEILVRESGLSRIFFCNSGAEANEGCIKLVRKWGRTQRNGSYEIIAMEDGFHGRSLAAVTASGTAKYSEPFQPLPPGFLHVPYNDIEALRGAVTSKTCAVLLEPVQGKAASTCRIRTTCRPCAASVTMPTSPSCSTKCKPGWGGRAASSAFSTTTSHRT